MFDYFFEKVNEPFRSDFGHNGKVLIWLWVAHSLIFLALLVRDFFSVRRRMLLGKELDEREKRNIPLSLRMNWLFIVAGAALNLYQIQYIMFHNSMWWTAFCCSLLVLELGLIAFDCTRAKKLIISIRNYGYSTSRVDRLYSIFAVAAVILPIACAFVAQAQYAYDQQFIGC